MIRHYKIPVKILNESVVVDTYFLYVFLRKLVTPFDQTEAFKLGIIDKDGKILKKRSQLNTTKERRAYTILDTLVWNLKKILQRIPFGRSRLASYAAALWLLKESDYHKYFAEDTELLTESFQNYCNAISIDFASQNDIIMLSESVEINIPDIRRMLLETPANNVGDGKIAGTGVADGDQIVVRKKKKILRRKEKDVEKTTRRSDKKLSFKEFRKSRKK